ncbi:hypothetical protein V6N12_012775 [Hibiscus sabdariffa]|uniref:Uncharacterized protein n=1 Tax=Hibiscus sabdariffa TaxID=183260 RepID=A0ABR2EGZ9_9ROSI
MVMIWGVDSMGLKLVNQELDGEGGPGNQVPNSSERTMSYDCEYSRGCSRVQDGEGTMGLVVTVVDVSGCWQLCRGYRQLDRLGVTRQTMGDHYTCNGLWI